MQYEYIHVDKILKNKNQKITLKNNYHNFTIPIRIVFLNIYDYWNTLNILIFNDYEITLFCFSGRLCNTGWYGILYPSVSCLLRGWDYRKLRLCWTCMLFYFCFATMSFSFLPLLPSPPPYVCKASSLPLGYILSPDSVNIGIYLLHL